MTAYTILGYGAISEESFTTPTSDRRFPLGTILNVETGTAEMKRYIYIYATGALTAYIPYELTWSGTKLGAAAPATGNGQIVVPQVAFTSAYYGWALVQGTGSVYMDAETYAIGDHVKAFNAGTTCKVEGSTGSTVRTLNAIGVLNAAGTTVAAVSCYLYGIDNPTIPAS